MNTKEKTTGRPHSISRAGKGGKSPARGKTCGQKSANQVKCRKHAVPDPERTGTEVIVHSPIDVTATVARPGRTRSNPLVYEAMDLLRYVTAIFRSA